MDIGIFNSITWPAAFAIVGVAVSVAWVLVAMCRS